jgi:uncharacterized protein (TIGR02996 family)
MQTDAAFLAQLRADPADDVTRLVYADWLEDQLDLARAEFLRLTVRLATEAEHPERGDWWRRLCDLGTGLDPAWLTAAGRVWLVTGKLRCPMCMYPFQVAVRAALPTARELATVRCPSHGGPLRIPVSALRPRLPGPPGEEAGKVAVAEVEPAPPWQAEPPRWWQFWRW